MTVALDSFHAEYEQGYRWRKAWMALANKGEPNRLQSKQERIEHRAVLANGRVGKAMRAMDAAKAVSMPSAPVKMPKSMLLQSIVEAGRCLGVAQAKNDKDAIAYWSMKTDELVAIGTAEN